MFTTHTELTLTPYRDAFEQMALGAIVVRNGLSEQVAGDIRRRVTLKSFTPYRLAHRGNFVHADEIGEPELTTGLVEVAEFITQTRLAIVSERCYRLTHRDYVLSSVHADELGFDEGARLVDTIVDLSESSSGEAQVVYAHKGEHFFAAPQLSRSISIIERRPSVTRYHRYLNHKMEGRVVYRHCVTLARTDVAQTDPPSRQ
jgi:hypothetical protein